MLTSGLDDSARVLFDLSYGLRRADSQETAASGYLAWCDDLPHRLNRLHSLGNAALLPKAADGLAGGS